MIPTTSGGAVEVTPKSSRAIPVTTGADKPKTTSRTWRGTVQNLDRTGNAFADVDGMTVFIPASLARSIGLAPTDEVILTIVKSEKGWRATKARRV
jgi:hypothetical protein